MAQTKKTALPADYVAKPKATTNKAPIVAENATTTPKSRSKPENSGTKPKDGREIVAKNATTTTKKPAAKPQATAKTTPAKPKAAPVKPVAKSVAAKAEAVAESGEPSQEKLIIANDEDYAKYSAKLSYRQRIFAEVYASSRNGVEAAIKAGYSANRQATAPTACNLLKNPIVRAVIDYLVEREIANIRSTADSVLESIEVMAKADVNDVMELRRVACRHCHGTDFAYQETPSELAERTRKHDEAVKRAEKFGDIEPVFDHTIELGYNGNRDPHPDCPECWGNGKEQIYFHDTRTMSAGGRALYSGVSWGKDGLKVSLLNKDAAIDRLAKHHKLYEDKVSSVTLTLNADELTEKYANKMRQAHERMEAMRKERGGVTGG